MSEVGKYHFLNLHWSKTELVVIDYVCLDSLSETADLNLPVDRKSWLSN
jgi:hypothetical protein